MEKKLRIGRIPYANLFPIFYTLEKEFDCSSYEFVEGVPSRLNRMLHNGEVDLSPSSSVEYLRNPSLYRFIDNHSVSSRGQVGSILLFSRKPLEELNGSGIAVTSQSETSVALLEIILRKFYDAECSFHVAEDPANSHEDAYLLIGDEALKHGAEAIRGIHPGMKGFLHDLGDIWYQKTGLPFVFALWIVRKELYEVSAEGWKRELFIRFVNDLDRAKEIALKSLPEIVLYAPMRSFMSEEDILTYWKKLDYELDDEHRKGLELFDRYLKE